MKKLIYKLLRNDIISKLQKRHNGDQLITGVLSDLGLEKMPEYLNPYAFRQAEYDKMKLAHEKSKEVLYEVEKQLAEARKELWELRNPKMEPKYKVGDTTGIFSIWKVENKYNEIAYKCINQNGEFAYFRESQIDAMMQLKPKV